MKQKKQSKKPSKAGIRWAIKWRGGSYSVMEAGKSAVDTVKYGGIDDFSDPREQKVVRVEIREV